MMAALPALTIAIWADAVYLSSLPPEKAREILQNRRLDSSPEVKLAREYIETDGLRGDHAQRLIEFARDLARRREV